MYINKCHTNMEESIYNLIPQESGASPSSSSTYKPSYTSTFRATVKDEARANKQPCKIMGPSGGVKVDPASFLKTGTGLDLRKSVERSNKDGQDKHEFLSTKPPVPRHNESPMFAPPSNKNHVKENTRRAVATLPRQVAPTVMDVKGKVTLLEDSGLIPKYSSGETYGKVPKYLERRHQEDSARALENSKQAQLEFEAEASKKLTEEERMELLAGLRANWNKIHHEYQGISVITDTVPKRTRKAGLEAKLTELEADIARIEKNKIIYIQ